MELPDTGKLASWRYRRVFVAVVAVCLAVTLVVAIPHPAIVGFIAMGVGYLCVAGLIVLSIFYGMALGVILPPRVRVIKRQLLSEGQNKAIFTNWTYYFRYVYYWVDQAVPLENSIRWACTLESLGFHHADLYENKDTIPVFYINGLTPNRFEELYQLGITDKEDFIAIAKNGIDSELVREVFPLISSFERRAKRINGEPLIKVATI